MDEEIRYWQGKPVTTLSREELLGAIAEIYRKLEWAQWEAQSAKTKLAKSAKGKP